MTCPNCGLELRDMQVTTCPYCNQTVKTTPLLDPDTPTLPRQRAIKVTNPLSPEDLDRQQSTPPEVVKVESEWAGTSSTLPALTVSPVSPVSPVDLPIAVGQRPTKRRRGIARLVIGVLVFAVVVGAVGYYVARQNPVIYQSSLKGSLASWEDGADCAPKADGYHIMSGSICYAPIGSQTDADIKVSVTQLSGSIGLFYGIVLRSTSKGQYYLFGIDGYGKWLFVNVRATNQPPINLVAPTLDNAVDGGLHQMNTLEVKMKGPHFDFSINGTKVGETNNTQYTAGQIGLSGEAGVEVVYTDLSIIKVK